MCGQASPAEPEPTADERRAHLRRVVEDEYETLYRRIGVLVYRVCGRLRREEAAERVQEVLSETVRRALQSADHYDPSRSALAWLIGIALNVLLEQRRGQTARPVVQTDLHADAWQHALEGLCTATELDATAIRLDIRQALGRLEESQRRALELRYFEGLDGAELARALEAPSSGAARVRLTRALQALRKQFGPVAGERAP